MKRITIMSAEENGTHIEVAIVLMDTSTMRNENLPVVLHDLFKKDARLLAKTLINSLPGGLLDLLIDKLTAYKVKSDSF
jgi:hypothetical protein